MFWGTSLDKETKTVLIHAVGKRLTLLLKPLKHAMLSAGGTWRPEAFRRKTDQTSSQQLCEEILRVKLQENT